jgi:uncharacterized protein
LGKIGGLARQLSLLDSVLDETIQVVPDHLQDVARIRLLMLRYGDVPMDYADATMVVVAESRGVRDIVSLDSHFLIYRLADGSAFNVIR